MVARPKRRGDPVVVIRDVPIGQLHQADWNPREISEARMESLKTSILDDPELMWQRPILAMADGTVYAGNQRLQACIELAWETVPAILEDVPENVAQRRAIVDNASWGQWNEEALATILSELPEDTRGFLGFTDDEMVSILRQLPEQPTPPPPDDGNGTYVQNEEGERGRTPTEMVDNWREGIIRNVVLYYEPKEYERVSALLADIREYLEVETNAEAVIVVLGEAHANDCPSTEGTGPDTVQDETSG
jgi:hypothetical protein